MTVGDVLVNNGIVLDGDDVSVPAQTAAAKGVTGIAITRVSTTTRSEQAPVAFTVEKRNDSTLLKGTTKTSRDGKNGTQTITYTQTLKDGVVASEVESSRVVNVAPTSKVVLVGTKAPETQGGSATFYSAASGTCAHKTLPMGTIVTVTNTKTGASTTCRVADRGPYGAGRVIDLSRDGFSKIASISQGVAPVSLAW